MVQWITSNIDKILLVVGAGVVLFWPKIKQVLASKSSVPQTTQPNHPCCCCPPVEPVEVKPKSQWVTDAMSIRDYCDQHRLSDGVTACDKLINELVSGKPDKPVVKVAAVKK